MKTTARSNTSEIPVQKNATAGTHNMSDLNIIAEILKTQPADGDGTDGKMRTVFKTDGLSMVPICLHLNTEICHTLNDGCLILQVLQGNISFHTGAAQLWLDAGQMVTLTSNGDCRVYAPCDSVVLLTLSKTVMQQPRNPSL